MRDAWKSGIEWYIYYSKGERQARLARISKGERQARLARISKGERQARLARIIMDIKSQLAGIGTMGDLGRHYAQEHHLVRRAVKKLNPRDWWLETHQAEDVAYGLHCIELATGQSIDLNRGGMPSRWVVETVA